MKTIKIEKEATKADVYVILDTPEKLKEALDILDAAGEVFAGRRRHNTYLGYHPIDGDWFTTPSRRIERLGEITIPQLAELLGVEYPLKQLPTLEELIAEAKSKITVKTETYPCWVDGTREVKTYYTGSGEYHSEKSAIVGYISQKLREEYL